MASMSLWIYSKPPIYIFRNAYMILFILKIHHQLGGGGTRL